MVRAPCSAAPWPGMASQPLEIPFVCGKDVHRALSEADDSLVGWKGEDTGQLPSPVLTFAERGGYHTSG